MQQRVQSIYRQMQADIDLCRRQDIPELDKVECCFRTVAGCWVDIREELSHYRFASEEEEITFFKHTKPLFTSQIELYTLIYQGLLFRPREDLLKIAAFWANELLRLNRFSESRQSFIRYYKSGDTSLDRQYFLRHGQPGSPAVPRVYERNTEFSTSHDWLVAALIAQERYHEYARERLREISS